MGASLVERRRTMRAVFLRTARSRKRPRGKLARQTEHKLGFRDQLSSARHRRTMLHRAYLHPATSAEPTTAPRPQRSASARVRPSERRLRRQCTPLLLTSLLGLSVACGEPGQDQMLEEGAPTQPASSIAPSGPALTINPPSGNSGAPGEQGPEPSAVMPGSPTPAPLSPSSQPATPSATPSANPPTPSITPSPTPS